VDKVMNVNGSNFAEENSNILYVDNDARDGNYFSNRVINLWNSLPNHVVSASSVGAFKQKLQNLRLPLFIM